jgi:hypothetical protein
LVILFVSQNSSSLTIFSLLILQSLEIYDRLGKPLHPLGEREETQEFIETWKKLEKWRVPAVKRRVQEYLILEKRMWVQGPWVFREQTWPTWSLDSKQSKA